MKLNIILLLLLSTLISLVHLKAPQLNDKLSDFFKNDQNAPQSKYKINH